jgi:hypothetical protein
MIFSIKLYNYKHSARLEVVKVYYNGGVKVTDQERCGRGSIHKPSFCGLYMQLTQTIHPLNAEVHNIVKEL